MWDTADPRLLHFTHVENLAGIAATGLVADCRKPSDTVECADLTIKERRRTQAVRAGPGGVVADYAPFYFAPRSPMLYRIHRGGVKTYSGRQEDLVYLVSRVSRVEGHGLAWAATDRNAALATAKYTDQAARLATHVDWDVMRAQIWTNTPTDGSRRERRLAEFLVHRVLPWTAVVGVVVRTPAMAQRVGSVTGGLAHRPDVAVLPGWYF
ncbi:DUF4433 domain-containing protein [Streptomyces sp. Z26]|uniref:type II toxin-antitoxin system toxin DNA ADP-ribosyl transferase DarT n=1 Tax=Streptomyces TaxID=1883 RepID=UPI000EF138E9|nr:DUF4433 domain-containing protein [Streptomyces sp. Z26]RLL67890.1 DUF4433 domain-containing protein [Streptomyces sp. Z26]